jgi:hypothetical protein
MSELLADATAAWTSSAIFDGGGESDEVSDARLPAVRGFRFATCTRSPSYANDVIEAAAVGVVLAGRLKRKSDRRSLSAVQLRHRTPPSVVPDDHPSVRAHHRRVRRRVRRQIVRVHRTADALAERE